ncbi:MAG: hypothetical protein HDT02_00650 [Bacteroidales bacterium]|nr:hypothetical protein [Bacteroidales bacterium]
MDIKSVKKRIASLPLVRDFFHWKSERHIYNLEKERFMKEAADAVANLPESERKAILDEYAEVFKKYRFSYPEYYYQYNIADVSQEERDKFISRSEVQCFYRKLNNPAERLRFHNKAAFLCDFAPFIHRKWLLAGKGENSSLDQIIELLHSDVIIKPLCSSFGVGVSKIKGSELTPAEREETAAKLLAGESTLVEECIRGCEELESFHPSSLNTVRVVTENSTGTPTLFHSFVKFGRGGSVIDNAHDCGGLLAEIDIKTGVVCSNAITTILGDSDHEYHPDSHKQFKGLKIPHWEKMINTCIEAHKKSSLMLIGWDVAITQEGEIEIVEGNHAPDVDAWQQPLKRGIKEKFMKVVEGYKRRIKE